MTDFAADKPPQPLIFGEILFDCFPDGAAVLGGAPFNVSWNLRMLGARPLFIGAVGADSLGQQVRTTMADIDLDAMGLQTVAAPTGRVEVTLNQGEPQYAILPEQAYDHISAEDLPTGTVPLLYHGSLALRNPVSRKAWQQLAARAEQRFVDVNLRAPWFTVSDVLALVQHADYVKLNADEAALLFPGRQPEQIMAEASIQRGLIVTHGAAGAAIYTPDGASWQAPAPAVTKFQDPVGAGDAFASVVIFGILHGWPWPDCLQQALDFSARVCGLRGATTQASDFYNL